tara:strand:- start:271 stop:576 length:306 start_codon:yes stop_codon:yes gene_type:complete
MKTFEDIKFKQHQSGKGIHGKLTIENGMSLSVVAGQYFYSEPRSDVAPNGYNKFEVAIFDKDGEWATQEVLGDLGDDVLGWQTRNEINSIIKEMYSYEKSS